MEFIFLKKEEAGRVVADKLAEQLKKGEKVLWFLSGGSNIPIETEALNILKRELPDQVKERLSVTLTDERYGPVGHPDSNWQQLIDGGFDFSAVRAAVPVLDGSSLEETARRFAENYQKLSCRSSIVIGQFGLGEDGHTAGVLPGTAGVSDTGIVCSYVSEKFTRITLTLSVIKHFQIALTFAFGPGKKAVVASLRDEDKGLSAMPAQILKKVSESYLFSDQL